jgi:hypothetical protein
MGLTLQKLKCPRQTGTALQSQLKSGERRQRAAILMHDMSDDHDARRRLDLGQDRGRSPRRSLAGPEQARRSLKQIADAWRAIFAHPAERLRLHTAGRPSATHNGRTPHAQFRDRANCQAQYRRKRHELRRRPDPLLERRQMAVQNRRRAEAFRAVKHLRLDQRDAAKCPEQEHQRWLQTELVTVFGQWANPAK